jgi:anti-sigma28 factor (negative regulator of flagellin synthesis)
VSVHSISGSTPGGHERPSHSAPPSPPPTQARRPRRDSVELSDEGRLLSQAEDQFRFDLVSRLRAEVRCGTYSVDPRALARAMVERGEQG